MNYFLTALHLPNIDYYIPSFSVSNSYPGWGLLRSLSDPLCRSWARIFTIFLSSSTLSSEVVHNCNLHWHCEFLLGKAMPKRSSQPILSPPVLAFCKPFPPYSRDLTSKVDNKEGEPLLNTTWSQMPYMVGHDCRKKSKPTVSTQVKPWSSTPLPCRTLSVLVLLIPLRGQTDWTAD